MLHRLVVIGSQRENVELVRRAKERGYYTIVCDGYKDGPAKLLADKKYDIDVRDVDGIVEMCLKEKVDGIIGSFSDLIFEQIAKIVSRTDLKWYINEQQLSNYRNKHIQKNVLQELGVSVPKHTVLYRDFDDDALQDFSFPLVVKPLNGWGSKGIFVADSIEDIRKGFKRTASKSTFDTIEVEEYIEAGEYNMTAWVYDGRVYTLSIADREKNPRTDGNIPLLNRIAYPAKKIRFVYQKAEEVLQTFVDKTGQKSGPISMQFFYKNDRITVCEIAGRIFGYEHELITYCSDLYIEDLLLDYVYDERNIEPKLKAHNAFFEKQFAGLYFVGHQDMVIKDQQSVYDLGKNSKVVDLQAFYKEGETIDNFGPNPYFARYYISADSRQALDELTEYFFETIKVRSVEGNEVLYKCSLYREEE